MAGNIPDQDAKLAGGANDDVASSAAAVAAAAASSVGGSANGGADLGAGSGATGNGVVADAPRGVKRPRPSSSSMNNTSVSTAAIADDDDDDDDKPGRERRKIEIKFIQDKSRRHITFSKRKAGIMKKAYELSVLTGTQVLLLVVSETGLVYTFTTPKLQPLVTKPEGKNLIQACLNAPEPASGNENGVDGEPPVESPEDGGHAQVPQQAGMPRNAAPMPPGYGMTPEQALHYQRYMQQQQQQQQAAAASQYPMPPQSQLPPHPQH